MTYISCYIASAFQIASLYLMIASDVSTKDDELINSLNDEQKKYYKQVVNERKIIFLMASLIGLIVVLAFHFAALNNWVGGFSRNAIICLYTSIYFMVEYFVYSLIPKKKWMLNEIGGDQDLVDKWIVKYNFMKTHWHIGLLLGLVSFGLYAEFFLDDE
jgi:uncharacterized membrane protein YesL